MRRALVALVALVSLASTPATATARIPVEADRPQSVEPNATFVSTSGIPHAEVGDLRASDRWRPGDPIGISRAWRRSIDIVLDQIAAERPDAVFHTGDMVDGRWHLDAGGARMFGPTRTDRQRRAAIRRAGALYYRQVRRWWADRDLDVYYAMGDHEVGDLSASGSVPKRAFQYAAVQTWKRTWAQWFTRDGRRFELRPKGTQFAGTAYAVRLADVGLVTLDPIDQDRDGLVARIGSRQLAWLDRTLRRLRRDGARYLIVQCEVPAIGPNRGFASSGMLLANGRDLWRMLRRHDVDLLLSGEYHAMTAHTQHGSTPVQVVHGGRMRDARVNYLVIRTYDDRITLELRRMSGEIKGSRTLFSPAGNPAPARLVMEPGADLVGTMTIHADGDLSRRTRMLREGPGRAARARWTRRLEPAVERIPALRSTD